MATKRLPIEEQTMLVTGSTDGIGRATAMELARRGARVIVHGRNDERAQRAAQALSEQSGNPRVEWIAGDFSSLRQIRRLADEMTSRYGRLDVLINNAGVVSCEHVMTEDGLEITFAVNYVAPFLLTQLLLDLLKQDEETRIINISSDAHHGAYIEFDNLQGERNYDPYDAYNMSKLALLLFTYELARRLQGTHITVNALHPGVINTKLLRAGYGAGGQSVGEGAETPVYLATSDEVTGQSGKYFVYNQPRVSSRLSYDRDLAKRLWDTTLHLLDVRRMAHPKPWVARPSESRP